MEFRIRLSLNDYLTHQLFSASISERIRKKRKTEMLVMISIFLVLAVISYFFSNIFLVYYFLFFSIASFFIIPRYVRWRYRTHYTKHIKDVYRNNFGKDALVIFNGENIETSDSESNASIKYTQIKEINEISTHFFVHLKTGYGLILPKRMIGDIMAVRSFFYSLSKKHNINVNQHLNWKWR